MAKKFLGGAFARGDYFNTCVWEEEIPTVTGRFTKPIRNRWGKIVGYAEHKDRVDVETLPFESLGVAKAVALWGSRRMRLLRRARFVFSLLENWYTIKILWRRLK